MASLSSLNMNMNMNMNMAAGLRLRPSYDISTLIQQY